MFPVLTTTPSTLPPGEPQGLGACDTLLGKGPWAGGLKNSYLKVL